MLYLGLTSNFDNTNIEDHQKIKLLNKDYEGKGLDESAYLEFWQEFNEANGLKSRQSGRKSS